MEKCERIRDKNGKQKIKTKQKKRKYADECVSVCAHTIPLLHDDHVSCNHADRNERRSLCECKCIEKRL